MPFIFEEFNEENRNWNMCCVSQMLKIAISKSRQQSKAKWHFFKAHGKPLEHGWVIYRIFVKHMQQKGICLEAIYSQGTN